MARTLATLGHISDLHIGDVDFRGDDRDDARFDPVYRDWWKHWSMFDGYFGHEHRGLVDIVQRMKHHDRRLQRVGAPPLRVVCTGDITSCGEAGEFLVGATYLESQVVFERHNHLGLARPVLGHSVPGNHDRWPGRQSILGAPTSAVGSVFGQLPRQPPPVQLANGCRLVFAAIDTEADVFPWGLDRLSARGDFVSHLNDCRTWNWGEGKDEIRVLLMHHTRLTNATFSERICRRSRDELEQFLSDLDFAAVLTGHVHEPLAEQFAMRGRRGQSWNGIEACAGTSSQRREPPLRWALSPKQQRKRTRHNTLMLHHLEEDDQGIVTWRISVEMRDDAGYVELDAYLNADPTRRQRFPALDRLSRRIAAIRPQVWPRPP